MDFGDWMQLFSVVVALLATLASWRTVVITNKQLKLQNDEKIKKYRPFFKIKNIDKSGKNVYWFDIVNEGFPFYTLNNVRWVGDYVVIQDQFKGLTVSSITADKQTIENDRYEAEGVFIKIADNANIEGYFELNGFDLEHNDFVFRSPTIVIKDGKIKNEKNLAYQYLR